MNASMTRRDGIASRRFVAALCAVALLFQVGCHSFLPLQDTAPANGEIVSVTLNDRGRAAMSERMGEGTDRVEGYLMSTTETVVGIEVTRTVSIRGSSVTWTREAVEIPRDGIRGFQQRKFSGRRTLLLVATIGVGLLLAAELFGLAVFGRGTDDGGLPCVDNCGGGDQL